MRPRLILSGLAACLLAASPVVTGQASAATARPVAASPASVAMVPSFGPVFVIVGENESLSEINSSNAPYITGTLEPSSAWFTNYDDVAKGSLADYTALTSGQYAPCQTDGPCGSFNVPSIFSQLGNGNWLDWNESMPANCYNKDAGSDSAFNPYKNGHNPGLYYTGLPCSTYDVPAGTTEPDDMSIFNADLAAGTVPEYNFITPNECEDGYQLCSGTNKVTEYDNFLSREIPLIEQSPAFGSNGIIFVTFDEGAVSKPPNPNTMMAVVGPQVQTGTYTGDFNHYSTLATVEQGLGLPCLANACTASTLPVFGGSTQSPSVSITQPANGSTVSGTVTVAGTAVAQGSASISKVQVSVDNGAPQTATGTTSWSDNIDTTTLANGTHTITATATDSNNLTATASITITVNNGGTSCPAPPSGATELSGNVSVESSQTGWTGIYNSSSAVTRVKPTGGSYDGSWAIQVARKSGSGAAGVNNANPIWVTNTTAGQSYQGSVFVNPTIAGEVISLLVKETTPSGTIVGKHLTTITATAGWQQITSTYTAQDSGDYIRYSVYASNLASTTQDFLADCLSLWGP